MSLHGCGALVHVVDGVITKIEDDPTDPATWALCPKGTSACCGCLTERVKAPMVRTDPEKGPGVDPGSEGDLLGRSDRARHGELEPIRETDPRRLLVANNDFQRIFDWAWPAAFGSPHFFSTSAVLRHRLPPDQRDHRPELRRRQRYEHCEYWMRIGSGDGFSRHLHLPGSAKRMADGADARDAGRRRRATDVAGGGEGGPVGADPPRDGPRMRLGLIHSLVLETGSTTGSS